MAGRRPLRTLNNAPMRFRVEKWAWIVFVIPDLLWLKSFVWVVNFLSVYALVLTAASAEKAAEAAMEATSGDPEDASPSTT